MREIKFRAWNPNAKEYQGYAGNIHMPLHEAGALASSPLVYEFQQYTGLKDKNGKEIYEGDIVQYNTGELWFVEWDIKQAGFIYMNRQVVDGSGRKKSSGIGYGQLPGSHEAEVIGNIYENSELLERSSDEQ